MSLDILYVAHNRRAYTEASFEQLLAATDWSLVRRLVIYDDNSTDGTQEYLSEVSSNIVFAEVADVTFCFGVYGSPVAVMNAYLDSDPAEAWVKIDSDVIVPPGWLNVLLATARVNPNIDVLGFEPGFGDGLAPIGPLTRVGLTATPRCVKMAPHVGGVGLIRTRIFQRRRRPKPHDRWFGWTQFMRQYARTAWLSPDIPSFLLDHIQVEPWKSLAASYIEKGYARAWNEYFDPPADYYEWWTKARVPA